MASGKRRKHRKRFAYSPALTWLRRGCSSCSSLRCWRVSVRCSRLTAPTAASPRTCWPRSTRGGNNLLAYIAGRMDSYAFYSVDVWMKSLSTLLVAVVTFAVLLVLAWRSGRTYCNTICPVGTVLGFLARYSLFKTRFDTSKCNGCKALRPQLQGVVYRPCGA